MIIVIIIIIRAVPMSEFFFHPSSQSSLSHEGIAFPFEPIVLFKEDYEEEEKFLEA